MRTCLAALPLLALLACGADPAPPPDDGSALGEAGRYTFAVEALDGPRVGDNRFRVTLAVAEGGAPLEAAEVELSGWMPAHGHGHGGTPAVVEEGGGGYLVSGVVLPMGGSWEVRVVARADGLEDEATFTYEVAP